MRLETMKPEAVRVRIRETRRFVEAELSDLRKLLNGEPRLARTVLAKHIRKIVLGPQENAYLAVSDWNLLGLGSYGGARGARFATVVRMHLAFLWPHERRRFHPRPGVL